MIGPPWRQPAHSGLAHAGADQQLANPITSPPSPKGHTMTDQAPRRGRGQPVRDVSPERAAKIQARADELEKAEAAYRAELMAALDEDRASIRAVAAVAGRSPVTIQTWWNKHREDQA